MNDRLSGAVTWAMGGRGRRPRGRDARLSRRTLVLSAAVASLASVVPGSLRAAPSITPALESANRRFSILYRGREIGRHVVRSAAVDGEVRVDTEVDVIVKRLLLTLFSYRHRSAESWRDGRLMALRSETTEGGETVRVEGAALPRGFRVVGREGPFIASPAALTSNCMWNAAIVEEETVIDAEHGGVMGLSVSRLSDEELVIGGRPVAATRFRFITATRAGTIWYDEAGWWVRGELERYGARFEYRLET